MLPRVLLVASSILVGSVPLNGQSQTTSRPGRALTEAPYRALDRVEGEYIDLGFTPINPMAFSPSRHTLYALNAHASQVQVFDLPHRNEGDLQPGVFASQPIRTFDVPWAPASVAYWDAPGGNDELLVVSRGTQALTRLDPDDGKILGYLPLPSEPGGVLLVDDHLFVACSGEDVVVEIDLARHTIHDRFEIDSGRKVQFLSGDGSGNVLVVPTLSGNNSIAALHPDLGVFGTQKIVDLEDPGQAYQALPDEDVFRLLPGSTPFSGRVEVVARQVGTQLYAHGVNPRTGDLWVFNVEALNKDPDRQDEPSLQGDFVRNRLTITDLPRVGRSPRDASDHAFVQLDDSYRWSSRIDFSYGYAPAKPFQFCFTRRGRALVIGTLSDNVHELDRYGFTRERWDLPQGSIPRAVAWRDDPEVAFVYCWGTNKIEVYNLDGSGVPWIGQLDLGEDPTPASVRRGRELFYDGHNSELGNASCESCHVDGGTDFLAWNLSDPVFDDKGPMVTQTLVGLEATGPYHWRGERNLNAFNRAFPGLLGGASLSTSDFTDLQAFLFSLRHPANPYQDDRRVLVDDPVATRFSPYGGARAGVSALRGQRAYLHDPAVGTASCNQCHTLPLGTSHDAFPSATGDRGNRSSFITPAMTGLWRKLVRSREPIQMSQGVEELRQPVGVGLTHSGNIPGLSEFMEEVFHMVPSTEEDIAFFLHQFDSGIAPAAQRGALLSRETPEGADYVRSFLLPQQRAGNCDVAAIGTVELPGLGEWTGRWFYDRSGRRFLAEREDVAPQTLSFFLAQAEDDRARLLFVGLPVGMGRRWSIDFDGDRLANLEEGPRGLDPYDADHDGDGFLDGTEVRYGSNPRSAGSLPGDSDAPTIRRVELVWKTTRKAKILVETDEPTQLAAAYWSNGEPAQFHGPEGLTTHHTLLLEDLVPSYETLQVPRLYRGRIRVSDQAGNSTGTEMPAFFTDSFITATEHLFPVETVIGELSEPFVRADPGGGTTFSYRVRVDHRKLEAPAPMPNHAVVARVIVNGALETNFLVRGAPPAMEILGLLYPDGKYPAPGPFAIGNLSGPSGYSTVEFTLPDAQPGDRVQIAIEVVGWALEPQSFSLEQPSFNRISVFDYPSTPGPLRLSPAYTL